DQAFDVGRVDRVSPDVMTDDNGKLTYFRLPDGNHVQIEYNAKGDPTTVVTGGHTIEKGKDGKWRDKETGNEALQYVSIDKKSNPVTICGGVPNEIKVGPDGHYQSCDYVNRVALEEVMPDGTAYKRTVAGGKVDTETKYEPGSHIAETKSQPGTPQETVS